MGLRILFVDDEQLILDGINQMLGFMKPDWQLYFAESGKEALELLSQNEIDIIISDMRMPEMDGAELLEIVKVNNPSIIRMILSAYTDKEMVLRASKTAHQFLAKPIDAAVLKNVIEKVYSLQSILHNPKIISLTNSVKNLPSLPELYMKIQDEMKKTNPSIKKIDEIITKDMIMTAKILQVVNSAFFGLPQRIINPLQAVNFLGVEIIKALVLLVHFFSSDASNDPIHSHLTKLWDESLKVATLAKKIAQAEKLEPKKVEEAFIGSLLHDIGKLVLWQVKDYFHEAQKQERDFNISTTEAEYSLYETSHAEVGAYLLGVWGLPEILIEMVAFHHKPSNSHSQAFSALTILHAADHIVANEPLDENYLQDFMLNSAINKWIKQYKISSDSEEEDAV